MSVRRPPVTGRLSAADLAALVRTIPNFPKSGVLYRDVTTLIADGAGWSTAVACLTEIARDIAPDVIVAVEARGFLFGGAIAANLGIGVVPVRKSGKLPGATIGVDYALEYGHDRLEMHLDAIAAGARVVIVDDLLATGGTVAAAAALVRAAGANVAAALFAIDLPDLGGAARLGGDGIAVHALMAFPGH